MPKILKKSALLLLLIFFLFFIVLPSKGFAQQCPAGTHWEPSLNTCVIDVGGDEVTIPAPGYGITTSQGLIDTIGTLIKVAFGIAAFLCFVYLLWGGVQWITSGGDKAKYEEARNRITAAIIGLAIVAAAWAVMLIATKLLGLEQLTPEGKITIPGLTF